MSNDALHETIKRLLQRNGAMGVNQLQRELGIPLSTLQKYLDKQQSYFKKNYARKWVLPEVAAKSDMSVNTDNLSNIIEGQLTSIEVLTDTLMSQLKSTMSLIEANKPLSPSVAGKTPDIDARLIELQENSETTFKVFKKYVNNIPDKYKDLILNADIVGILIDKGKEYVNGQFNYEITNLLLEHADELSEDTLDVLNKYQKGE